ncbi:MAG: hypothetical protein K2I91_03365, partial [Muribaculaceae bacterium]|nr:hypothetical protein [Muribaculaceae bacterium]
MNTPQGNIVDSGHAFCMMRFPGDRRIFCTGFREDDLSQDERIEFLFNLYDNTGEVIKLPCTSIVEDYTGLTLEDFDKCYEISLDIESSEVHKKFDYRETTEDEHLEIVSDCVRFLSEASKDGVERKIVLSRTKLINMKRSELRDKLINLFEFRKDALVFYYGLPELGTWFGASPEILLTRTGA